MDSAKFAVTLILTGATIAFFWRRNTLVNSQAGSPPEAEHRCPQDRLALKRLARPSRSRRFTPRTDICLRQVYPTPENETETDADIIAIHGLDAESPETWVWRAKKPGEVDTNWLADEDMLPKRVGQARIFTCDWPADLFERSDSIQMMIQEIVRLLLRSIKARPSVANGRANEDRPILFIASCLGGIILMAALVAATGEYLPIRRSTRGIIFLATPFQGTSFRDVASWAVPGLQVYAAIRGRQLTKLLDSLKDPTLVVEQLTDDFVHLCLDPARPYQVMTFYELGKTNLYHKLSPWLPIFFPGATKQLVERSSATLRIGRKSLPLCRPHVLMNKFCCPEHPHYDIVAGTVADFLEHIRHDADAWIRDKYYTDQLLQIERLSGEPLHRKHCYINLTIVEEHGKKAGRTDKRSGEDAAPHTSKFSLAARLKVETPDKNIKVGLPSLFDQRKASDGQTKAPRRILIRGRAGVGKTTLCKKMVYEFTNRSEEFRKWIDLFDRVLWVPLRKLKEWSPGQYDLEALFSHEYFAAQQNRDTRTTLAKEFQRLIGNGRTLFILDGLDEISQELSRGDHKSDFLHYLLNQPNVVITSRPYVSLSACVRPPDLELETIGFYAEQVTEYLQATFSNPNKVDEVQSFLRQHQLIEGLVRIPILLDALCYTWDSFRDKTMPQTMTAIYMAIEENLWKKDIKRLDKQIDGKSISLEDIKDADMNQIENIVDGEIYLLQGLSFTGMCNDIINFESKHRNAVYRQFRLPGKNLLVPRVLPNISFLRTSDSLATGLNQHYHFLHLTFQEYFAARYFVRQWKIGQDLKCLQLSSEVSTDIEPTRFLQTHKYNARYDIFWRFVAGLFDAEGKAKDFFNMIQDPPLDLLGPAHQRLVMHCLSEVSSNEESEFGLARAGLEERLAQWLLFECSFSTDVFLAREAEFPENALSTALRNSSHLQQLNTLEAFTSRPYLPKTTASTLVRLLRDEKSYIQSAAARALRSQTSLPQTTVSVLEELLRDENRFVQSTAALALKSQTSLPETIINTLIGLLRDENRLVQSTAAEALKSQTSLPETIINTLIRLLRDENSYVQRAAAEVLKSQTTLPETIINTLIKLLQDKDSHVQGAAAETLGCQTSLLKTTVSVLEGLLQDKDSDVRRAAAWALKSQTSLPETTVNVLEGLLRDKNSYVQRAAANTLGNQTSLPETTVSVLEGLLQDKDSHVQGAAADALGSQTSLPETTVSVIKGLLQDEDSYVRWVAAKALGSQTSLPETIINPLIELLRDKYSYVQRAAAKVLGSQTSLPETTVSMVEIFLQDEYSDVQRAAAWVLKSQISLPETTVSVLEGLLPDKHSYVQQVAAKALKSQKSLPETIINTIIELLQDKDSHVRGAAAETLGCQTSLPETTVSVLEGLLQGRDSDVRRAAAWALKSQTSLPETTVNVLEGLLRDKNSYVQEAAANTLGNQTSLPETTVSVLEGLLQDMNSDVRQVAAKALEKASNRMVEQIGFVDPKECAAMGLLVPNNEFIEVLYRVLLGRSFREHLVWLMPDGIKTITLDMQGRTVEATFKDQAECDRVSGIVNNTRKALDVHGYKPWTDIADI